MSQLQFPLTGVRQLEATTAFPPEPWTLRQDDWSQFLVPYRLTVDSNSTVEVVAPSVGTLQLVPQSTPPMLVFHPMDAGSWVGHFKGWRAPVPSALCLSFESLEEPTVQRDIVSQSYQRLVGNVLRGTERVTTQMAAQETAQRLAEWRDGVFTHRGPILRRGDVIRSLGAPQTVRLGLGHVQTLRPSSGTPVYRWYWFDVHEYLLRLSAANAFTPLLPRLTSTTAGGSSPNTDSFRIWFDTHRNDPDPALRSLSGGPRRTTIYVPNSSGLPIVSPQLQYLSPEAPLFARGFDTPTEWAYDLYYGIDPQKGRLGSAEESVEVPGRGTVNRPVSIPGRSTQLDLPVSTFALNFENAQTPVGPIGIRLLSAGRGPTFVTYRDSVDEASVLAAEILELKRRIEAWLGGPNASGENAERLVLSTVIREIVRTGPAELTDPSANHRSLSTYFSNVATQRELTRDLGTRITPRLFEEVQSNPTYEQITKLSTIFDALTVTPDGEKILRQKFAGFIDPERSGDTVVSSTALATLWNDQRTTRSQVARIFGRAAQADLYYTVKTSGASDTALNTYRRHFKSALDGFTGLSVVDTTLSFEGTEKPWFDVVLETRSGRVSTGVDPISVAHTQLSVLKILMPFKILSNVLKVYTSTKALVENPSLNTVLTFTKSVASVLDDAAKVTESHRLTRVTTVLKRADPVYQTATIGNLLIDISEAAKVGDDDAAGWLYVALGATVVGMVASAGLVAAGLATLAASASVISGALVHALTLLAQSAGRSDIQLRLDHTVFGADHEQSPWKDNVPLQIATLNSVRYPLRNATFSEESRVDGSFLRIQFSPRVSAVGSMVTFDLWKSTDYRDWDALGVGPTGGGGAIPGGQFVLSDTGTRFENAGLGVYRTSRRSDGGFDVEINVPLNSGSALLARTDRVTVTVTMVGSPLSETDPLQFRQAVAERYGHATRTVLQKQ